jgi:hypothetical protein
MNYQLPPATGTTLTDNMDLEHQSATCINFACLDSQRRRMGVPMTLRLDDARRKYMAHNFPSGALSKEIDDVITPTQKTRIR